MPLCPVALDGLFVLHFGWDVRGVALGTLIAEYSAVLCGLAIAVRVGPSLFVLMSLSRVVDPVKLKRTLLINGNIMLRSLALVCVFVWFVGQGARQGDVADRA